MNKSEIKICQNCKASFEINASDFEFYAKIKVPPPTWCPECRMVRRFLFRGWRKLYKRKTEGYDADVYSKYSLDTNLKIYHESYYVSDNWDAAEYGREYDFSRPFFAQFADLFRAVPKPHRDSIGEMTGSDYCDNAGFLKNCYLVFNTGLSENCMYGTDIDGSRDCADVARVKNCELCYDLFDAESCYRVNFSAECVQCSDVWFSKNLVGCDNCVGCVGLRNKQYYIFNEPHTKKEYFKKIKEFNFSSFKNVSQSRKDASIFTLRFPARFMRGYQYVNATGDYIYHSKNVRNSFNVANMENCAYCQLALFGKTTDSMDVAVAGGDLLYEGMVSAGTRVLFGLNNFAKDLKNLNLSELQYCAQCRSCHNLFACVGLRNKQYCILNKQYTKEEYEKLVPQIIEHMNIMPYIDKKGRVYKYGEFFPLELSPFSYNETIAQEYFPLTKEQAIEKGYSWKDSEERNIKIDLKTEELKDNIKDVKDDIVDQVIECQHKGTCNEQCTTAFKIIKPELDFYRKMNLPLPRLCPNCRHYQKLKQRNPLKLWKRQCQCAGAKSSNGVYANTVAHTHETEPCSTEFETSYAPERPEIVYCEKCYQSEVV